MISTDLLKEYFPDVVVNENYIFVEHNVIDVLNFLNWIYKDSTIYLDRKYEHYLDFINNGSKYHKTIK